MRSLLPSNWRVVGLSAGDKDTNDSDQGLIILSYCELSMWLMYAPFLIRPPSKHTYKIFTGMQVANALCLEYLVRLDLVDLTSERNIPRTLCVLQLLCFNYVMGMAGHCLFDATSSKPLSEEEQQCASMWQRFDRRWQNFIGTNLWRNTLIWRLLIALSVSLALVGSEIGLANLKVLHYGFKFSLAGFAVLALKVSEHQRKDLNNAAESKTLISETNSLPENRKVVCP